MAETWWSNVSLLSKVTPRVLILSVIWTVVPATLTEVCGGKVRLRWWVLSQIASDLSGFKARPLTQNHSCSVRRHRSRRPIESYWPEEVSEMKSCVSSAYCWWWIPDELMIWPTGEVKPKIGLGPALNPEERQCSARCQSILIDHHNPSEPCRLSTNESNWSRYLRYRNPVWSLVKRCGDQLYQTQRSGQVIQGLLADWSQQPCIPDQAYLTAMFLWSGTVGVARVKMQPGQLPNRDVFPVRWISHGLKYYFYFETIS